MRLWISVELVFLAGCLQACAAHATAPTLAGAGAGDAPARPAGAASSAPNVSPAPLTSSADAQFYVQPLPKDSPLQRWQQFCWVGSDAMAHLNEAGAQGWELVSVSVAVTPQVAIPHSKQFWVSCFKRPMMPTAQPASDGH